MRVVLVQHLKVQIHELAQGIPQSRVGPSRVLREALRDVLREVLRQCFILRTVFKKSLREVVREALRGVLREVLREFQSSQGPLNPNAALLTTSPRAFACTCP